MFPIFGPPIGALDSIEQDTNSRTGRERAREPLGGGADDKREPSIALALALVMIHLPASGPLSDKLDPTGDWRLPTVDKFAECVSLSSNQTCPPSIVGPFVALDVCFVQLARLCLGQSRLRLMND